MTDVKAGEIGTILDAGGDLDDVVAWTASGETGEASIQRIEADLPVWIVDGLDRRAQRLGLSRDALLRLWVSEHLQ